MKANDQDVNRIDDALKTLGEHFDSVQIFCSRHESGEHQGTLKISKGVGNFFARIGQIKAWTIAEDEAEKEAVRRSDEI